MEHSAKTTRLPRRGNALLRGLAHGLLRLFGWRLVGELPDVPKCVAIAAHHTTNWDFVVGMCAMFAWDLRVDWIGKHTIFRAPFGGFMRWMGGTPVTREPGKGVVAEIVERMAKRDRFVLGLAPEGTRKQVDRWRTGFYQVAVQAGVPILLAYFDYAKKHIGIGPLFRPTGDPDADMAVIREFYRDKVPRYPERVAPGFWS